MADTLLGHPVMDHRATTLLSKKLRRTVVLLQATGLRRLETMAPVWQPIMVPRLLRASKTLLIMFELLTPVTVHLLRPTVTMLCLHLEHMDQGTAPRPQPTVKLPRQPTDHLLTVVEPTQPTEPVHTAVTEM